MKPLTIEIPQRAVAIDGKVLNELVHAIRRRTPIAGAGLIQSHTPKGVILSTKRRQ